MSSICKILGILTVLVSISISQSFAKLDDKKSLTINYKGAKSEVLEKTVWVRLKSGATNSISNISGKLNSSITLTPVLHAKNSKTKINSNIVTSNLDHAKIAESEEKLARTYIMEYSTNESPEVFIRNIKRLNSDIEIAEPYYVYELQGSPNTPDDPELPNQSTLDKTKIREAWAAGLTGSKSTIIAIGDVGVNTKHEDLKGNIAYNTNEIPNNGIDDDNNGYIDDYAGYNFSYIEDGVQADDVNNYHEHGTNVAGIAVASTNNGLGMAGTGNQCRYFPLKICRLNTKAVVFGYQSILYAAENGIPVINCSWGRSGKAVKQFSQIEQDIITYATNKGVSIVAAGGNQETGSIIMTDVFYPAYYDGVLGVGEVDMFDVITHSSTTLSLQTAIMAPGIGNLTCKFSESENEYVQLGVGTSFASPVVAGFLGLIRSKYPELSAREAIEFARLCTDDITATNGGYDFFLPGRVNMLKATEMAPFSKSSIRPVKVAYADDKGNPIERLIDTTQEITMNISAYNYLGADNNLKFKIVFWGTTENIQMINSEVAVAEISARSSVNINGFKFKINGEQPNFSGFKVLVYKGDVVIDYFTIPVITDDDIVTLSNNVLRFSVSDYGRFGSSINQELNFGAGFTPSESFNMLHPFSGLVLCIDGLNSYSSTMGEYYKNTDFKPVKRFFGPAKNIGSFELGTQGEPKLLITTKYTFPDANLPLLRADFEIENLSDVTLDNPSLGMLFDWDMPTNFYDNYTNYFPEAVPDQANKVTTAAQFATNFDESEYIGTLVFSEEESSIAQSAGFPGKELESNQNLTNPLTKATSIQYDGKADIVNVIGMKFVAKMVKNEKKRFSMLIGYSKQKSLLASILKNHFSPAGVNENNIYDKSTIYPNPASEYIQIDNALDNTDFKILNCIGECLMTANVNSNERINIKHLPNGTYFVIIGNQIARFIKQ